MSTEGLIQTPSETLLTRKGNKVTGIYVVGGEQGKISGVAEGNTIHYSWQQGGYYGTAIQSIADSEPL